MGRCCSKCGTHYFGGYCLMCNNYALRAENERLGDRVAEQDRLLADRGVRLHSTERERDEYRAENERLRKERDEREKVLDRIRERCDPDCEDLLEYNDYDQFVRDALDDAAHKLAALTARVRELEGALREWCPGCKGEWPLSSEGAFHIVPKPLRGMPWVSSGKIMHCLLSEAHRALLRADSPPPTEDQEGATPKPDLTCPTCKGLGVLRATNLSYTETATGEISKPPTERPTEDSGVRCEGCGEELGPLPRSCRPDYEEEIVRERHASIEDIGRPCTFHSYDEWRNAVLEAEHLKEHPEDAP